MEKMILGVRVASLSLEGTKLKDTSNVYLSLGEISIEKEQEYSSKEKDGMIV